MLQICDMEWKSLGPLLCGSQLDMPFMPAFPNEKHRHRRFILTRRGTASARGACAGSVGVLKSLRLLLRVMVGRAPELETEDKEERSKEALRIRRLRPSSQ